MSKADIFNRIRSGLHVPSDDSTRKRNLELLVKAKLDEMKAPTDLIEGKLKRTGELRVKLVMMRDDLEGARFAQTVHPGDRGMRTQMLDETIDSQEA